MTPALPVTMFLLGLAGSLHCVQMCGPLVLSFSLTSRQPAAHAAYHAGRILTYALLGALAGWTGSGLTLAGSLAGLQNTAAVVGGICMIVAAFLLGTAASGRSLIRIGAPSRFSVFAGRLLRNASLRGRFATGLAMGLLPCGMIYAALLRSVAAASATSGAVAMLAFGLGTAGPLFGLSLISTPVNRWLGVRGPNWAAAGIALMGAVLIWRGLLPPASHQHHLNREIHVSSR